MRLSDIRRDPVAIEQGEWVGKAYGRTIPEMGDLCLKVRGNTNSDWRRIEREELQALPRNRRAELAQADNDSITNRCILDACLQDWGGIDDKDGKPVPYSKEQAAALIDDPWLADFRSAILWAAQQVGVQRRADQELDAKN